MGDEPSASLIGPHGRRSTRHNRDDRVPDRLSIRCPDVRFGANRRCEGV